MKRLLFALALLCLPLSPAWATVTACDPARWDYNGNGSTTAFAYTCRIIDQTHLEVLKIDAQGIVAIQTLGTHYTVSGVGNSGGGSVTFVTAPTATEKVAILRKQPSTQGSDYIPGQQFPAESVERDLDRLVMKVQQYDEIFRRVVKVGKQYSILDPDTVSGTGLVDANKVFAGPTSGAAAAGSFRLLAAADIPNLNLVASGLTGSRCVETTAGGLLTVSSAACGSGSGDLTDVLAGTGITVTDGTGPQPSVAITANGVGPTQIDETAAYTWTGAHSHSNFALTGFTVATRPAAASNSGRIIVVTDGADASDCDTGGGAFIVQCRSDGTDWLPFGDGSGTTPTIDATFDQSSDGKITGATEAKPLSVLGSGTDGPAIYQHSSLGPRYDGICGGVLNDCDYFRHLNAGKKWGAKDRNGAEIFTMTEAVGSGALTNVTLNVESTGNAITTVNEIIFPFAYCPDGTAVAGWNRSGDGATAPTAACNDTGAMERPTGDFSGSAVNSVEFSFPLPAGFTGNIDLTIRYVSVAASPTGNVEFDVQTVCRAAGEVWDGAFNAAQTITDAVAAQNVKNDATQNGLTTTGCAAGEDLNVRVSRDGVNDTNNDLAKGEWAKFTVRRTQ